MLAGSLTEFGLADIFSLLAATRKTGVLNLSGGATHGRVWISAGGLCYAVADISRAPLAARLLHAGTAASDQVESLVAAQADGSVNRVTDALADLGLPSETARALLLDQVADAVFDLTRWADGTFSFDQGAGDGSVPVASAAEVLAIVGQREADWDALVDRVPGLDRTVTLVSRPRSDAPIQISPAHWEVLTLIDGLRSVAEIIAVSGLGQFVVTRTLAELHGDGLVRISEARADRTIAQHHAHVLGEMEHRHLGRPLPRPTTPVAAEPVRSEPVRSAPVVSEPVRSGPTVSESVEPEMAVPQPIAPESVRSEPVESESLPSEADRSEPVVHETDRGEVDRDDERSRSDSFIADLTSPEPAHTRPIPADRDAARRVRELAALGIEPDPAEVVAVDGTSARPAARDTTVNADLLARLIDGVKGA